MKVALFLLFIQVGFNFLPRSLFQVLESPGQSELTVGVLVLAEWTL